MILDDTENEEIREDWEREFLANHRWGRLKMWFPNDPNLFNDKVISSELAKLRNLWDKIKPVKQTTKNIIQSISALEICNWNLENSIINICRAIGKKESPTLLIGHLKSITSDRWKEVWAYYLSLCKWLTKGIVNGYNVIHKYCDPEGIVLEKISTLLGERSRLKELYVERLCLLFEFWLSGYNISEKHPQMITHSAAVKVIEEEILKNDPEGLILKAMKFEGDGRLQPCNHKAFRRYDIIISSIGAGKWRAIIPMEGIDGLKRAAILEKYLFAIETWTKENRENDIKGKDMVFKEIHNLLGKPDNTKIFLATLLVSLLRPQQIAAEQLALSRSQN
jgi:hypothetical protein